MSLAQLAERTELSVSYLSNVERGLRGVTWENTLWIADELGVHPEQITGQWPPYRVIRQAVAGDVPFADFATSVGLSYDELIEVEQGLVTPDAALVARLAQRLGVPAEVLTFVDHANLDDLPSTPAVG